LLKVANDSAGTDAGARALLTAAGKQFVDGKTDEAKASFQRFIADYPESVLIAQAKYGIAVCLDAQGKTSEAATAFKEVVDRYAGENTTMPAKFALARIYEADGKLEQARDYYLDIARDGRSTFGMEAGSRLTALIQKHPNLRPVAPAAVNRTSVAPAATP
jgi:TolA-binding protein